MTRRIIALRVNGRECVLEVDAAEPLIETLRELPEPFHAH